MFKDTQRYTLTSILLQLNYILFKVSLISQCLLDNLEQKKTHMKWIA